MSDAAVRERAQAFLALGDMANALAPVGCAAGLHSFLPRIAEQVSACLPCCSASVVMLADASCRMPMQPDCKATTIAVSLNAVPSSSMMPVLLGGQLP